MKRGPHRSTMKKAFDAALKMRQGVLKEGLRIIHAEKFGAKEERNFLMRLRSTNPKVQDLVELLQEMDATICNLSKFI